MSCELAKCAILSMQLHRSATYWVHNDTPSGVLRPPKRFMNFVACGNLDRHSRFCLSRFRLCHNASVGQITVTELQLGVLLQLKSLQILTVQILTVQILSGHVQKFSYKNHTTVMSVKSWASSTGRRSTPDKTPEVDTFFCCHWTEPGENFFENWK